MNVRTLLPFLFLLSASVLLISPRPALAQDHVVPAADFQKDAAAASAARQKQVEQVDNFISSPEGQQALKSSHIDYQQVKNGVAQLSDEDLARLSAQSEKAQKDFAAGNISDRDLILILVALIALIAIIVAVR